MLKQKKIILGLIVLALCLSSTTMVNAGQVQYGLVYTVSKRTISKEIEGKEMSRVKRDGDHTTSEYFGGYVLK